MSVQSEMNRISGNIADTYDELQTLGATMPLVENSANLASTVQTIQVVKDVKVNTVSVVDTNHIANITMPVKLTDLNNDLLDFMDVATVNAIWAEVIG